LENKPEKKILIVSEESSGLRLDKYLGQIDYIGTRSRAEHLIEKGLIHIKNSPARSSYKVKAGDEIEIFLPQEEKSELQSYDFKLDILFEDEDVIVVNKPVGLVVHPAAGHQNDTLVNALIAHTDDLAMKFGEDRPGIIHRLDKETSGILVVAKNDSAQEKISQQFRERTAHRIYYAICLGIPAKFDGTIQSFLARHPTDRKKYASLRDRQGIIRDKNYEAESGKWAVTHYKVLDRNSVGLSYLQLKLETGRTHQIRVHLSEMGWPLLADSVYTANHKIKTIHGNSNQQLLQQASRCALHAAELGFIHPRTGENMMFKVDWPDYQEIRQHFFPGLKK
jgi:23S rRNA pseudouridine1911/1915/1917 synthase